MALLHAHILARNSSAFVYSKHEWPQEPQQSLIRVVSLRVSLGIGPSIYYAGYCAILFADMEAFKSGYARVRQVFQGRKILHLMHCYDQLGTCAQPRPPLLNCRSIPIEDRAVWMYISISIFWVLLSSR
jgi:hypothetical protein